MKHRKALQIIIVIVALTLAGYLVARNSILHRAFNSKKVYFKQYYHADLNATGLKFAGFDHVKISSVSVTPENADTLFNANNITLNLSLLDLLQGKIAFDEIMADGIKVNVSYNVPNDNISFLKTRSRPVKDTVAVTGTNYHTLASGLTNKFLRLLNTPFQIRNIHINYTDSTLTEKIFLPVLKNDSKNITTTIINQRMNDTLMLSIKTLKKNEDYEFRLAHLSAKSCFLPFMGNKEGLQCSAQVLTAKILLNDNNDELQVTSDITAENLEIQHWRLANGPVSIPKAQFAGSVKVAEDFVELDSSSTMQTQGLPIHVFCKYQKQSKPVLALGLHIPEIAADTFFNSLPAGIFNTMNGIVCQGRLEYSMDFLLDTDKPDSLTFNSALKRKNLRIIKYGEENYSRINQPFTHNVYEKDKLVRQIVVGPANPYFTSLTQISPYLITSVLQSEDPSFMIHNGFIPEAFRESIIQNYKEKRFARGGSTISMQLVKNVFLNRNKTVSRKVEEALIVYLIENLNLVSKERMLEVYLNIIEWGPGIYGIGEASRFYFNKPPAELTLQESIFLAAIIPRPKYFRYQFNKDGHLKPYLADYFRILSNRMVAKGRITESDTVGLIADVRLKGPALRMVIPSDTIIPEFDLPALE